MTLIQEGMWINLIPVSETEAVLYSVKQVTSIFLANHIWWIHFSVIFYPKKELMKIRQSLKFFFFWPVKIMYIGTRLIQKCCHTFFFVKTFLKADSRVSCSIYRNCISLNTSECEYLFSGGQAGKFVQVNVL